MQCWNRTQVFHPLPPPSSPHPHSWINFPCLWQFAHFWFLFVTLRYLPFDRPLCFSLYDTQSKCALLKVWNSRWILWAKLNYVRIADIFFPFCSHHSLHVVFKTSSWCAAKSHRTAPSCPLTGLVVSFSRQRGMVWVSCESAYSHPLEWSTHSTSFFGIIK